MKISHLRSENDTEFKTDYKGIRGEVVFSGSYLLELVIRKVEPSYKSIQRILDSLTLGQRGLQRSTLLSDGVSELLVSVFNLGDGCFQGLRFCRGQLSFQGPEKSGQRGARVLDEARVRDELVVEGLGAVKLVLDGLGVGADRLGDDLERPRLDLFEPAAGLVDSVAVLPLAAAHSGQAVGQGVRAVQQVAVLSGHDRHLVADDGILSGDGLDVREPLGQAGAEVVQASQIFL